MKTYIEKSKEQNEKETIEFLRKKYPDIIFDESLSQENGLADLLEKIKDKKHQSNIEIDEDGVLHKIFVLFMMTFFRSFYLSLKYERYYLSPIYKLISGILMLSASCYFIFSSNDYMHNSDYKHYGENVKVVVCITILAWFVKGVFRIGTFNNGFSHTGSGSFVGSLIYVILNFSKTSEPSTTSQMNIDRAISYRNARLGQLNGWEAADLLAKTSILDTMKNGNLGDNINLNRAASNLNAKLGGMTGFEAVDYIAGKK